MLQTNLKGPLTLAGIVIGLSLVLGLGGSWFLARALGREAQAVSVARMTSARAATLGPRIAALQSQEEIAARYQRVLALLMPTQEQLLEVPRNIEELGRSRQVEARFQFLGSPAAGASKPGDSLPFSLTASGKPAALLTYLEDLEIKNPRYTISISGTDMSLRGEESDATLSATGNFFYQ